jgi:hypothetical protein
MKDPSYTIRNAYYTLLNGQLTSEGNNVPVYDEHAPAEAPAVYVLLGAQTTFQRGSRTGFITNCSIIVNVVTRFPAAEQGNKKQADDIANQITQIINPDPVTQIDLSPDFFCIATNVEGSNSSSSHDQVYKYNEKAVRFSHIVEQL